MSGYRYFMKCVRLRFLILLLMFCMPYQGYTSCDNKFLSDTLTTIEDMGNKVKEFAKNLFTLNFENLVFNKKLLEFIKVRAVKSNSFFNSRIEVCDYVGNRCTELPVDTSCHPVYGIQETGGGVSAKVFIDWNSTQKGEKIVEEGDKDGLEWEWAEGVTEAEQKKFADSPKICACSQKDACATGLLSSGTNFCDTCEWEGVRQTIKCVPLPRAPNPPPFCEHLPCYSSEQVDVIPVKDTDNDYIFPKVRVRVGKDIQELDVQNSRSQPQQLNFKEVPHYFKTDRRNGRICARYCGTKKADCDLAAKFPERCFPAPHAPQPEIEEVVDNDTLKIKMRMSERSCNRIQQSKYNNGGYCTFDINRHGRWIGDSFLRVIKPKMKHEENTTDRLLKELLDKSKKFLFLRQNKCIPDVEGGYDENTKVIQYKYKEASESDRAKMLCISGWQPDPEESMLVDENNEESFIWLRLEGTKYVKCPAVYSLQSHKMFDDKCKDAELPQEKLDKVAFDIAGNIFFPDSRGAASCTADSGKEAGNGLTNEKCTVYKLKDSQTYIKKNNSEEHIGMFGADGKFNMGKYLEVHSNKPPVLIKVDNSEVFYADKLCTFDLNNLKKGIVKIVMDKINNEKSEISKREIQEVISTKRNSGNLSKYEYVDIEVWGNGEDGKLVKSELGKNGKFVESKLWNNSRAELKKESINKSSGSRPGKPGDYIKVSLRVDKHYPFISYYYDDNESIIVQMCNQYKKCKSLMQVAGGRRYGNAKTMMYSDRDIDHLKIGQETIVQVNIGNTSQRNNQILYIQDGKVEYGHIKNCGDRIQNKYGAGGCIDDINNKSGNGSRGAVKITPIYRQTTEEEAESIIDNFINNIVNDQNLDSSLIKGLDTEAIKQIIDNEIKQELSCG